MNSSVIFAVSDVCIGNNWLQFKWLSLRQPVLVCRCRCLLSRVTAREILYCVRRTELERRILVPRK